MSDALPGLIVLAIGGSIAPPLLLLTILSLGSHSPLLNATALALSYLTTGVAIGITGLALFGGVGDTISSVERVFSVTVGSLLIVLGLVHLQDRFRVTGYSNAHENSDLRQREGPSRPPSEVLAPEEDPRRFRPAERRGVAGDAPPLSERVRIPDEPVDSCDGLRGGLRRGTHRRARLGGDGAGDAFAPARGSLDAGEAVDNLPRPLVRKKKRRRDRLMEVAGADPEWAVGFLDECWWSQVALPTLNAWAEEGKPPRLIQRSVAKDDPEPKAISCYGLYLPALD